jgi:hypothetical protein
MRIGSVVCEQPTRAAKPESTVPLAFVAEWLKKNKPPPGLKWHQQLTEDHGAETRFAAVKSLAELKPLIRKTQPYSKRRSRIAASRLNRPRWQKSNTAQNQLRATCVLQGNRWRILRRCLIGCADFIPIPRTRNVSARKRIAAVT